MDEPHFAEDVTYTEWGYVSVPAAARQWDAPDEERPILPDEQ